MTLSPDDNATIQRLIDRHGGMDLWNRLRSVELRVPRLDGPLMRIKGIGHTFPKFDAVTVEPGVRRVTFHDYPSAGHTGIYLDGRAAVGPGGPEPVEHRASFDGWRKYRRWSPVDAVYFFGYAVTTYVSVPFVFPSWADRVRPWGDGVRVRIRLPQGLHSHSARQEFFYNADGLLVRHDYIADVVGKWAQGAHFTSGHVVMEGFPIPTRRRVFARFGDAVTPIPVLSADIEPVRVTLNPA